MGGRPRGRERKYYVIAITACFLLILGTHRTRHGSQLEQSFEHELRKFVDIDSPDVTVVLPSNQSKPFDNRGFILGTVIRGNEWIGVETHKKRAVLNALRSYTRSFRASDLLLLVDDITYCEQKPAFLRNSNCAELSGCVDIVYGSPKMNCVFSVLLKATSHLLESDIVGFINGDILIFESFAQTLRAITLQYEDFLMVGRRRLTEHIPKPTAATFSWQRYEEQVKQFKLDGGYAVDYFMLEKRFASVIIHSFPPFIIGTQRWDNAFLASAFKVGLTVIDATLSAPVLHQGSNPIHNHGKRPAAEYNEQVARHTTGYDYLFGTIDNAAVQAVMTHISSIAFLPCSVHQRLVRCAYMYAILSPESSLPRPVMEWLALKLKGAPKYVLNEYQLPPEMAAIVYKQPRLMPLRGATSADGPLATTFDVGSEDLHNIFIYAESSRHYFFVSRGILDEGHPECFTAG